MKKLVLYAAVLCSIISFTSCDKEDVTPDIIPDPVLNTYGVLVLNEGNYYSKINGTLSLLDYEKSILTDGIFQASNNRSLGGTPNDMSQALYYKGYLYICCTDENRVEVVDPKTFKSIKSVEIPQPRCVVATTTRVYVSSYDGTVYSIDYEGNVLRQSEKIGACLEGICDNAYSVYVCNAYNPDYTYNTNIVKLNYDTLEKEGEITVACNPTKIKNGSEGLYVLSSGNYADVQSQLQLVDYNNNVKYVCDATHFDVGVDAVYAINSVTDWTTYETKTEYFKIEDGVRKPFLDDEAAKEIASPCGIAVVNDYVFISSYSMGAYGYSDYSAPGYIMQYKKDGTFVKRYEAGVGPTTMIPLQEITYVFND